MTTAERLLEAIETHAPEGPDGKIRSFHRMVRHQTGRIAGSYYALVGYLYRNRPIPDSFLEATTKVLPGVSLEWLRGGDAGATPARTGSAGAPAEEAVDLFGRIRPVVERAGAEPTDEAMAALDPKYPRDGLSRRNWSILYAAAVGGKSPGEIAKETGLSAGRVKAIRDEYAELVRAAAQLD